MNLYLQRKNAHSWQRVIAIDIGIVLLFVIPKSGAKGGWLRIHSVFIISSNREYHPITMDEMLEYISLGDLIRIIFEYESM